jgi:hypothetical protein
MRNEFVLKFAAHLSKSRRLNIYFFFSSIYYIFTSNFIIPLVRYLT